jgi:hypothetical protein
MSEQVIIRHIAGLRGRAGLASNRDRTVGEAQVNVGGAA